MAEKVRDRVGPLGWLQFFSVFTQTPHLRLNQMQNPFLIIGGQNDIASFPGDCTSLAAALPSATAHILNECGHFCILEQPQIVLSLISYFLKQHLKINSNEKGEE
jgi:pimeloyl-ACP methyl ester carboxylesterase